MSIKDIRKYLDNGDNGAADDGIDEEMRKILNRPGGVSQAVSMFWREAKLTGTGFGIDGTDRGSIPVVLHSNHKTHQVVVEKPDGSKYPIEEDPVLWAEAMRRARLLEL